MNAYELTKELSEFMTEDKYTDLDKTIFKTCNMLRQQADEIQALKDGFNAAWGGTNNSELAEVRAMANRMILKAKEQADRIAKLSKNVDELEEELLKTPQIKELSDEEIEKVRVVIMEAAYWCAENGDSESYNAVKVMCSKVLAMLRGEK